MLEFLLSFFINKPSYQYPEPLIIEQVVEIEIEEIEPIVEVVVEPPVSPCVGVYCTCMVYLQLELNLAIYGDAIDQVPNKPLEDIEAGDVILINYDGVGHAAYVKYRFPNAVWVEEANYINEQYSERAIVLDDKRIRGAMKVGERGVDTSLVKVVKYD